MSLVFTAIVPHPPSLAPTPAPANPDELAKTRAAYQNLEKLLYSSKPDLLVIITPHGTVFPSAWQVVLGDTLSGNLEEFSDFSTKITVRGSIGFSHSLKERAEDHRFPVVLQSARPLNYSCIIPLLYLTPHLPQLRVVPLVVSGDDIPSQYEFGKLLREELFRINDRVAVIASADLAHRLNRESPLGYSRSARLFDEKLRSALESGSVDDILTLSDHLIEDAVTCGLRPIALLLGTLFRKPFRAQALAYEYPHGVGYYTAVIEPA